MTILSFELRPGGVSRAQQCKDTELNQRFSDLLLESVKLFLDGSIRRRMSSADERTENDKGIVDDRELKDVQRLSNCIEEAQKSNSIMMGGSFPYLVAQKSLLE